MLLLEVNSCFYHLFNSFIAFINAKSIFKLPINSVDFIPLIYLFNFEIMIVLLLFFLTYDLVHYYFEINHFLNY